MGESPPTPATLPEDPVVIATEVALLLAGPVAWVLSGISLLLVRFRVPYALMSEVVLFVGAVVGTIWSLAIGSNPVSLYIEGLATLLAGGATREFLVASAPISVIVSLIFVRISLWRPAGARRHRRLDIPSCRWVSSRRIDFTRSLPLTTRKGFP